MKKTFSRDMTEEKAFYAKKLKGFYKIEESSNSKMTREEILTLLKNKNLKTKGD